MCIRDSKYGSAKWDFRGVRWGKYLPQLDRESKEFPRCNCCTRLRLVRQTSQLGNPLLSLLVGEYTIPTKIFSKMATSEVKIYSSFSASTFSPISSTASLIFILKSLRPFFLRESLSSFSILQNPHFGAKLKFRTWHTKLERYTVCTGIRRRGCQ